MNLEEISELADATDDIEVLKSLYFSWVATYEVMHDKINEINLQIEDLSDERDNIERQLAQTCGMFGGDNIKKKILEKIALKVINE